MALHEAQSYQDPGSFEEQSRRTFLANATVGIGAVIGLVIAVPVLASLIPESLVVKGKSSEGTWADLPKSDFDKIAANSAPVKISFDFLHQDGYFPPAETTQSVWGIKLTPAQEQNFKNKRPDLYTQLGKIDYPAITLSYVMFSSICPHLGCQFNWDGTQNKFICPCHGSEYSREGAKLAGPAARGLDPLPFREKNGTAEVTWIDYKSNQAARIIVAYS